MTLNGYTVTRMECVPSGERPPTAHRRIVIGQSGFYSHPRAVPYASAAVRRLTNLGFGVSLDLFGEGADDAQSVQPVVQGYRSERVLLVTGLWADLVGWLRGPTGRVLRNRERVLRTRVGRRGAYSSRPEF